MLTADRSVLSRDEARRVLDAARDDALLYASVSLMLFAGLRPGEVAALDVRDYDAAVPSICTGTLRRPRTICIARSAAVAVDAYLATQETEPDEPLLLGLYLRGPRFRRRTAEGGRVAIVSRDLRQAAIGAALAAGVPMSHVGAYFGMSKIGVGEVVPVPEGYDLAVAAALEEAFS